MTGSSEVPFTLVVPNKSLWASRGRILLYTVHGFEDSRQLNLGFLWVTPLVLIESQVG